ncbi:MAG: hypothetical protein IT424_15575 [Pirellulales bacterium]|nr:hypothetical protein [Pirellulales bacterium]
MSKHRPPSPAGGGPSPLATEFAEAADTADRGAAVRFSSQPTKPEVEHAETRTCRAPQAGAATAAVPQPAVSDENRSPAAAPSPGLTDPAPPLDEHAPDAEISGGVLASEHAAPQACSVDLCVPILEPPAPQAASFSSRRTKHVEARLSEVQAEALRHLLCGLRAVHAEYGSPSHGHSSALPVHRPGDAVRWLLDCIAADLPACQALQQEIRDREIARQAILAAQAAARTASRPSVA